MNEVEAIPNKGLYFMRWNTWKRAVWKFEIIISWILTSWGTKKMLSFPFNSGQREKSKQKSPREEKFSILTNSIAVSLAEQHVQSDHKVIHIFLFV